MGCINTKKKQAEKTFEKDREQYNVTKDENGPNIGIASPRKKLIPDLDEEIRNKWEKEQLKLKRRVILRDTEPWQASIQGGELENQGLRYIGGVDISFVKDDNTNACAALIVVSFPELEVVYEDCVMVQLTAPYIPGFLAFREAGFLIERFRHLEETHPDLVPQLILVDGNGLLHPKEFGLACHLGVLLDLPTAGVAKKLFQVDGLEKDDKHKEKIEGLKKGGDTFPLVGATGRTLGVALRSCDSTKNPVYVSVGHKISLETTVWIVKKCCKHRIPEPVRQADIKSREYLRVNFKPDVTSDEEER